MTERALRAVCLWDDPPPSLQWTMRILTSLQDSFIPPIQAPSPPRGKSVRRTEGDPHFWLLDHIQVLTRDSDDSASTVGGEYRKRRTFTKSVKNDCQGLFCVSGRQRNPKELLNFLFAEETFVEMQCIYPTGGRLVFAQDQISD